MASLLGGLCHRASMATLWIAARIASRRPTLGDLKRVNPAVAATMLPLFFATSVLTARACSRTGPRVEVGLAVAAFAPAGPVHGSRLRRGGGEEMTSHTTEDSAPDRDDFSTRYRAPRCLHRRQKAAGATTDAG
jgi:hypothetical protein